MTITMEFSKTGLWQIKSADVYFTEKVKSHIQKAKRVPSKRNPFWVTLPCRATSRQKRPEYRPMQQVQHR